MSTRHDCPRCGRSIMQSGVVEFEGQESAVFQCDECLKTINFGGKDFEMSYTFTITPDGQVIEPPDVMS